jgi:hypothetical protein
MAESPQKSHSTLIALLTQCNTLKNYVEMFSNNAEFSIAECDRKRPQKIGKKSTWSHLLFFVLGD